MSRVLLVLALLAVTTPARAQMTATILSVGNRAAQVPAIPLSLSINRAECEADVDVVIRVANIPSGLGISNLDLWSGAGCSDQSLRATTTDVSCNCLGIDVATLGNTEIDATTSARALLGVGRTFKGSTDERTCANIDLDRDAPWPVLVLGVTTPCSVEAAIAYATIGNGTTPPFTVDTVPPAPPTNVVGGTGDTAVPVTWTASPDVGRGGTYELFDALSSVDDAGICGSTTLTAGGRAPTVPKASGIVALMGTLDATDLFSCGETGAVAVAAVDRALNVSPLSNIACFTRTVCPPPPRAASGCCATVPTTRAGSEVAFIGAAISALVILRRRR